MNERVQTVRAVFDDWARRGRDEGMERGHGPVVRQAFQRLALAPDAHYLDIGCGNGYTVRWAAEAAPRGRALGVDVSSEMIERARARTQAPQAEFLLGAFPHPQLPEEAFHAILSMEAFYYLPDIPAALAATRRLLRPGGRFACVIDHYQENAESHGWSAETGAPMTLWSAAEWRGAFTAAGFREVEQERLHPPLAPGESPNWKHEVGSLATYGRR